MTGENRNLILAIVLSAIILIGWTFLTERFIPTGPEAAPEVTVEQQAAIDAGATVGDVAVGAVSAPRALPIVLEQAPRVRIETPRLSGSINLEGARIDDLILLDHREELDPESPPIRLFAPSGTQDAWFAGFGWAGAAAPPSDARWAASAPTLAPDAPVTLSWRSPAGLLFQMVVAVDEDYLFTVTERVVNGSNGAVALRPYGFINRTGRGPDDSSFNVHVGPVAVLDGTLREGEIEYDDLVKDGPLTYDSTGGWLGISDKYWLAALIPAQSTRIEARFTAAGQNRYQTDYLTPPVVIEPGQQLETVAHLYAGAKEVRTINAVRDELGAPLFDRAITWGWFWFIAQPMFQLLAWFYSLLGNYGLAIIGLTLVVRILLFPIANRQYASMAKMRIFAPKMKEIQEKYKDDKVKQQTQIMELYRREKINPLAGCLPILLQIPIFFALYKTLLISTEIRHQPAFLWLRDLSAPDPLTPVNLFGLLPFDPPGFLHLGILPILLGITMFIQFKLNPAPMDELQKKMFAFMPWIFMFMMAPFAAGLQLYWIVNNLVSILQQWVLMKKYPAPAPAPAPVK